MLQKIIGAVLGGAFAIAALGDHASAALFSFPKSLKASSPFDGLEMSLPIWGPAARSYYCLEHLTACQPRPGEALSRQTAPQRVAMFGLPKALKGLLDRVPQDTPALAPMAHTMFCLKYPKDCEVRKIAFRGTKLDLTEARMADLVTVNAKVNRSIRPEANMRGLAGEKWLISPTAGDCNDYAVTKRHELLKRGWPSRTLLLAEVVVTSGEHHLVVVARTRQGDYVLDNLSHAIKPWSQTPYQWVRIQSAANPKLWSSVKSSARSA